MLKATLVALTLVLATSAAPALAQPSPNGNTGVITPFAPPSTQNGDTGVITPFSAPSNANGDTGVITPFAAGMNNFPKPGPGTPLGGAPAGEAIGSTGQFTAGSGMQGSMYNNDPTSDVTMTQGNSSFPFLFAPPDNTHTNTTMQNAYQEMTAGVPGGRVQTGLMAPNSVDPRDFKYIFDLGFPAPQGVTGPGFPNPQGANWNGLPDTGTPSVYADTTIDWGY